MESVTQSGSGENFEGVIRIEESKIRSHVDQVVARVSDDWSHSTSGETGVVVVRTGEWTLWHRGGTVIQQSTERGQADGSALRPAAGLCASGR
jgi:hypothetical protein